MPEAVKRIFKEEIEQEKTEVREEVRQEVFERMFASNIPEEQARAIAFG